MVFWNILGLFKNRNIGWRLNVIDICLVMWIIREIWECLVSMWIFEMWNISLKYSIGYI